MGASMAKAFASSLANQEIYLYDVDLERCRELAGEIGARALESPAEVVKKSSITLLAVKPQILPSLYPVLSEIEKDHAYISIAAGVHTNTLSTGLNSKRIVRFMPNIAASVSEAVTAVAAAAGVEEDLLKKAFSLAGSCGTPYPLPEKLFSAFIGISGSAIAFFFQFLHAIALGGTRQGIPYQQALSIAEHTCLGAIKLLEQGASSPADLITSVTSAGGTTIEGIYALEKGGFNSVVMDAVKAAADRGEELERNA